MHKAIKPAKKVAVFIAGVTIIIGGIALLVLPGPGLLLIFVGLLILATEFEWAAKHRDNAKAKLDEAKRYAQQRTGKKSASKTDTKPRNKNSKRQK